MSEDGVYPSSVPSSVECSFLFGDFEYEAARSRFNFDKLEVDRCSIREVRGVVQVV